MENTLNSLEASDLPKGKRRWDYDPKIEGNDEQQWEKNWGARKRKWGCEKMLDNGQRKNMQM